MTDILDRFTRFTGTGESQKDIKWSLDDVLELVGEVRRLRGAPLRQQADRLMQEVERLEKDLTALRDLYDATYNVNMELHDTIATLRDQLEYHHTTSFR